SPTRGEGQVVHVRGPMRATEAAPLPRRSGPTSEATSRQIMEVLVGTEKTDHFTPLFPAQRPAGGALTVPALTGALHRPARAAAPTAPTTARPHALSLVIAGILSDKGLDPKARRRAILVALKLLKDDGSESTEDKLFAAGEGDFQPEVK